MDDLLADIHRILDEEPPEEEPEIDLDHIYGEETPQRQPAYWTQQQRVPKHVAKLQKNQAQAYADWLYEQEEHPTVTPPPLEKKTRAKKNRPEPVQEPAKEKKSHGLRNFFLFLLLVILLAMVVVVFLLPKQPAARDGLGRRRDGVSTILLAGTDEGGMRTDTLMLLTVDQSQKMLYLVSIPRDTLVNGSYAVPKINSFYGANNCGEEGIEMLMTRVSQCIGFQPDGYILIRLDAFVELVDALGGVTFDVPVDMYYNDPSQGLYIDLLAGEQTLTGQEAMGVVRYRSGYTDADLGRVTVQRAFLSALIDQAASAEGVAKAPVLLNILLEKTDSNLTASNYLWLARTALMTDLRNIQTTTLPGSARNWPSGSYYVLDPQATLELVNLAMNPYTEPLTLDDLDIIGS